MASSRQSAKKRNEKAVGLVVDLALAVVFGVVSMPVVLRWWGWFACFLGVLYLLGTATRLRSLPTRTKGGLWLLCSILFWIASDSPAMRMWRHEKASVVSGHLSAQNVGSQFAVFPETDVRMQIGPGGTMFEMVGAGRDQTPAGSKLSLRRVAGDLLVTTDVRDRNGALIVQITDNDWVISPSNVWDKNYTDSSLEVKDKRGRVVLKVVLFSDRVQIEGEWWHEGGIGARMLRPFPYDTAKTGPVFVAVSPPFVLLPDEPAIKEMFKYPSDRFFGETLDSNRSWIDKVFILKALGL